LGGEGWFSAGSSVAFSGAGVWGFDRVTDCEWVLCVVFLRSVLSEGVSQLFLVVFAVNEEYHGLSFFFVGGFF